MANIKNKQLEFLQGGQENIDFKVFDANGTYLDTETENIAKKVPDKIQPLYKDLIKQYDKPLKRVKIRTKLNRLSIQNKNAHFLIPDLDNRFLIQPVTSPTISQIQLDTTENVRALSGNRYFKSNAISQTGANTALISLDQQYNAIKQRKNLNVGFSYYIETTDHTESYKINLKASLDESYSSSSELKQYNFTTDEWEDYPANSADQSIKEQQTSTVNAWGKMTCEIKPYSSSSVDTDVFITITIDQPIRVGLGAGGFNRIYIDNFYIAESYDLEGNEIVSTREQISNNGNFSGEHEVKDLILSNEGENTDFFIGKITGDFKRERDSVNKKLEQLISAEMMNDNRRHLTRYDGTFRDKSGFDGNPIGFHNKLHVDFGNDVYQDFQSCYIDSMRYNIRKAEVDVSMHVSNQDCDVVTTYVTVFD